MTRVRIKKLLAKARSTTFEPEAAALFAKVTELKQKIARPKTLALEIAAMLRAPVAIGGTHASPRLHWRRGHIRRLPSGECTQVRPCLVGHKSLGQIEKDYVLGDSSAEAS
jgi:Protein of unknown function (DUF2786)